MSDPRPHVVLLHGLGRTHRSMSRLAAALDDLGYPVWTETYPSRSRSVAALAEDVADRVREAVGDAPIFAVTHSMGGILARFIGERLRWRALVMLAPPNGGSVVAARMSKNPLFRWFFGPAGLEMGAGADAWPDPPCPFGVIAGTRGASIGNVPSWVVAPMLPPDAPNDGTLTVEETRHPAMADFATVPASHTWIMNHPDVLPMAHGFFDRGRFPALAEAKAEAQAGR